MQIGNKMRALVKGDLTEGEPLAGLYFINS
jgi:hypothetical protein